MRSDELKRHSNTHNKIKNYVCGLCDRPFGRSDHARLHMDIHLRMQVGAEIVCTVTEIEGTQRKLRTYTLKGGEATAEAVQKPKASTRNRKRRKKASPSVRGKPQQRELAVVQLQPAPQAPAAASSRTASRSGSLAKSAQKESDQGGELPFYCTIQGCSEQGCGFGTHGGLRMHIRRMHPNIRGASE